MKIEYVLRTRNGASVLERIPGEGDPLADVYNELRDHHWLPGFISVLRSADKSLFPPHPKGEQWKAVFVIDYIVGTKRKKRGKILIRPGAYGRLVPPIGLGPERPLTIWHVQQYLRIFVKSLTLGHS